MDKKLEILALKKIDLEKILKNCKSWNELYSTILNKNINTSLKWFLKKKINTENIDVSNLSKKYSNNSQDLSNILVKNSSYRNMVELKYRLFESGLKNEKCEICEQEDTWNNLPLEFNLIHVNGNSYDNQINNLKIICLHCFSQQKDKNKKDNITKPSKDDLSNKIKAEIKIKNLALYYKVADETIRHWIKLYDLYDYQKKIAIENKVLKKKQSEITCNSCPNLISKKNKSGKCNNCKSKCPPYEVLLKDLSELKTKVAIAKKYNITDNGVKKWLLKHNLL